MINRRRLLIGLVALLILGLAGCSREMMNEIERTMNANFGGYTKSKPLKVYVSPFKPHDEWGESEIGKIAWGGAVDGVKDMAIFSDKKMIFVGPKPKSTAYYSANDQTYYNALKNDGFWDAKGDPQIKKRLKVLAQKRSANAIIYGIYDGDDTVLKITVFLYSKVDEIILKERQEIRAEFKVIKSLVGHQKSKTKLTTEENALQKMIHEKIKITTARLIRKYMEGK